MSTEATAAVAAPPQGEVVASIAYVNGRRDHEVPIEEVGRHVDPKHGMVWIGLRNPSPERLVPTSSTNWAPATRTWKKCWSRTAGPRSSTTATWC